MRFTWSFNRAVRGGLAAAALAIAATGMAPAANAASWFIHFDSKLNGPGYDYLGTFSETGGTITSFQVTIDGFNFNYLPGTVDLPFPFPDLTLGPPTFNSVSKTISGPLLGLGLVTNNPVTAVLAMTGDGKWGSVGCSSLSSAAICLASIDLSKGVYKISEVPIPAALPLFATGVAAVAWAGRRKRKAAEAAA